MKKVIILVLLATLTGCGTLGGALQGAGDDLHKVGDWVRSK